ncbi:FAD-binding protein [Pseudomonas sp. BF-R-19]|uniref:FAD-binding protein n=1 Tax=Pseudomonas sp. BF-R-19 TaxID=2832397 RepID=UPI001CBAFE2C|nr:FAD-binding protein [Pseudomonas sp. BF-R-19]
MTQWEESFDLVIVGSGGGAMCAALAAKERGCKPLIIEKMEKVGGSTALSGGVWWVPNSTQMKRDGRDDSYEKARTYLDSVFNGYKSLGASSERVAAYLKVGPAMVDFLERKGMEFHLCKFWPDYYDNLPGGEGASRSLMAKLFNLKELGEWEERLNVYPLFDMPFHPDSLHDLGLVKRTWAGKKAVFGLLMRILRDKLTGSRVRGNGAALQGRMLQMVLRDEVPIWRGAPVEELIVEGGRVVGVVAVRNGRRINVLASKGVLLAAGGFARNAQLREMYQREPKGKSWTNANDGDTGEVLEAAMRLGAATENLDLSIWVATSGMSNGEPSPGSVVKGKVLPYMHSSSEMGKPHCILVNAAGKRFVNESGSYMAVGEAMYGGEQFPCWYIMDQEHRNRYMWGMKLGVPKEWLSSGYMKKADSIEELAKACSLDPQSLLGTVDRFNGFARAGVDLDFKRGASRYDHWSGDESNLPNPSLGAIEKGPFYAVRAYPGDVGTTGGLVCDEHARVLRKDGTVIEGLYATGNCTSSPLGRFYPGAGGSIASSFIFGYIAALHAGGGGSS